MPPVADGALCYDPGVEFTVKGVSFGGPVALTWRDGKILGHPARKALLEAKARVLEELEIPVGDGTAAWPSTVKDHLSDPDSVLRLMRWGVFQTVESVEGDVPKPPEPEYERIP